MGTIGGGSALDVPADQDVAQAKLPTALLSLDGRLLQVSATFAALTGTGDVALTDRPVTDLCPVEDAGALRAAVQAAREGVPGGEVEVRLDNGSGDSRPVCMSWTLVRDSTGAPGFVRSLWMVEDESRWQALLRHAADITWTADVDGTITSATPGALEQLGWEFEQIERACAFDFVHPEDRPDFCSAWERLVGCASRQEVVECRVLRADGGWTWMRETLTDLRAEPSVRAIVGNVLDITRWHHERQARTRQDAHLRARFEQSLVPQATVDVRGHLVAANDALGVLVGQQAGMLIEQPIGVLVHPCDGGLMERALAELVAGERESAQADATLIGPGGRAVPVLADLSLFRNEHGQPAGVALFWHDLSRWRDAEQRQRQQEEFFLALSRRASDVAVVTDAEGSVLFVSSSVGNMLGYDAASLLATDSWDLVHPEDLDEAQAALGGVLHERSTETTRVRVRDASGAWRHVEVTATNLLDSAVGGIACNLLDITDRVEAERALRASEARYRAIADTGGEGIWAMSPDGSTLYVNARMAEILGLSQEQVYAGEAVTLVGAEQAAHLRQRLDDGAQDVGAAAVNDELPYQHPDGRQRILAIAATRLQDVDGQVEGYLAMVSDVTDARRTEQELRHAAVHDGLTGLPNRTLLLDRLEHALQRETLGTAVIFIDLDHFKLVNDSRGHGSGDDVLVVVASRLRSAARAADTVARFGGDEFVVVCEDVDQAAAEAVAEQLLASLTEPVDAGFGPLHLSASVGVAMSPTSSASDLLRFADVAMYAAKASGRGRVRPFDSSLAEAAEEQYALAADLRAALQQDELHLHYQPVIELKTGQVLGMEALARWQHPEHGSIPPARFVAVAELAGLSPALDDWVLCRAMQDAAALRAEGAVPADAYVAVNLSARNLTQPRLEQVIVAAAATAGLPPEAVVLEITEGAIMDDPGVAVALLRRLRGRGFGIAIDDFGTGYSSLAYLRELPITLLKIDRSFITHIATDPDAHAIAASIADLARAVGVTVVAEGVETPEQAALLRRLGCRAGQGWLWSPAVAVDDVRSGQPWTEPFAKAGSVTSIPSQPRVRQAAAGVEHGLDRLLALHHEGASLATIAAALNQEGFRAPTGLRWHRTSVARVISDVVQPTLDA